MLIASGACKLVAVVYARNPIDSMRGISGAQDYDLSHGFVNAAAVHGLAWTAHMAKYGTTTDALGHIAVQQREHGRLNPMSSWHDPLTLEDYRGDPPLIAPLRELDICKVTAGGAALLLASPEVAADCAKRRVDFLSMGREASHGIEYGEHMSFFASPQIGPRLFEAGACHATMSTRSMSTTRRRSRWQPPSRISASVLPVAARISSATAAASAWVASYRSTPMADICRKVILWASRTTSNWCDNCAASVAPGK